MVQRVGHDIQAAVERFLSDHNMQNRLESYKWEFNLIDDTVVNAWAMPGGKVGVYKGILPVTLNDTGLAVVLGHEIAHAIANHGDERMSQALIVQIGGLALSQALSKKPELTRQLALASFGLGTEVGILLPYSRLQESEADHLGLIFMAMAGYDPHSAIPFWERMAKKSSATPVPEFLNTHPSDERRIKNITKQIPEAMQYFNNK
jgi:predicted Zn-dependent protease